MSWNRLHSVADCQTLTWHIVVQSTSSILEFLDGPQPQTRIMLLVKLNTEKRAIFASGSLVERDSFRSKRTSQSVSCEVIGRLKIYARINSIKCEIGMCQVNFTRKLMVRVSFNIIFFFYFSQFLKPLNKFVRPENCILMAVRAQTTFQFLSFCEWYVNTFYANWQKCDFFPLIRNI